MDSDLVQRDLGEHDARLENLEQQLRDLQTDVSYIKTKLDEMRGGTRVVLTIAAVIGSLVTFMGQWILKHLAEKGG